MNLALAVANAHATVTTFKIANPETHHFPCGFAWITYKCRKNAKIGKELAALGARWSDYHKEYTLHVNTRTQDMDYNAQCCRVFVKAMREAGFEGFEVRTQID